MTAQERIIAVVGATGAQGGEVVRALVAGGQFSVRALTRRLDSQKAKNLQDAGVEVVQADLSDKASLVKAFTGAHGVFLVTDTHSAGGSDTVEFAHGKNGADAAVEAGVKHLVWSTQEDPRGHLPDDMPFHPKQPGRKLSVVEVKADIEDYINTLPIHSTHLLTTAYYENWLRWYIFQTHSDGQLTLGTNVGFEPFSQQTVEDIGTSAAAIFEKGTQLPNHELVPVVGENISMPDTLKIISEVTGRQVSYKFVEDERARAFDIAWKQEPANLYQFFRVCRQWREDIRPPNKQLVAGTPFKEWALRNRDGLIANLDRATTSDIPYGRT